MKKASEKGELNGWVDLELAWNFAELGEKEAAKEYLNKVKNYLDINNEDVSKDYKIINSILETIPNFFS